MVILYYTDAAKRLTPFTLDAVPSETHDGDMEITEHPIESGANVVDHSREKPRALRLEVLIVDFPIDDSGTLPVLSPVGGLGQLASGLLESTTGISIAVSPFETLGGPGAGGVGFSGRAFELWKQLELLRVASATLIVETDLQTYDRMLIRSISTPRSVKNGTRSVQFTVSLTEVRFVSTKLVPITQTSVKKAKGKVAEGKKTATSIKPERPKSLALKSFRFADQLFNGGLP